jgi:hypothetical protein
MHWRARLVGLVSIATATACLPPSEVGRFARSASETTAEFTPVAREMYASCLRFESYRAQRSPTGWYDSESLRTSCASRDTAIAGLLGANRVLSSYFSALARLADDKAVATDNELTRLAISAKRSGMNEPQVNAVAALAKYLTSTIVDSYRRQKLKDAIAAQNGNVGFVTSGLRDVINIDYRRILAIETRAANDFYRTVLTESRSREPLAAVLVLKDRDERIAQLKKRSEDLDSYVRALEAVRAGHQKLYENRDQVRAKEVSAELVRNAEILERIGRQLEHAF